MFDTIRIATETELNPNRLMTKGWTKKTTSEKRDGEGQLKETTVYLLRQEEAPAYLKYSPAEMTLLTECSLPKVLRGENVSLLSPADIPKALDELGNRVEDRAGQEVPSPAEWKVRGRLDVSYCWQMGNLVPAYLRALRSLYLAKHRTVPEGSTVYLKNASRQLRFYDKFAESLDPAGKGLLRFEVELHHARAELKRLAGVEIETAGQALNWECASAVLGHFIDKLGVGELTMTSEDKASAILFAKYGPTKALQLLGFLRLAQTCNREELKALGIDRNTFWRNLDQLRAAGLNLALTEGETLPRLTLPEDYDGSPGAPEAPIQPLLL